MEDPEGPPPRSSLYLRRWCSLGFMRNSYIRPDAVYRSGTWRPRSYSMNPVEEARAIALDFTRDPSVINNQFPVAATSPNVETVTQAPMVQRRGSIVPGFIRRFFGGR